MSRVNKHLYNLSRDPLLYKNLNIRDAHFTYWNSDLSSKLRYFAPKCKYMSQLDLSFCLFPASEFIVFLDTCGRHLTHLKLNYCRSINDLTIRKISKICKNLKGLDLNCCQDVTSNGILYLEKLKFLERLHLQEIEYIKTDTLCNVLKKNREMRDLNLAGVIINKDAVAIELKNSCPNLRRINFTSADFVTRQGIDALVDCKNLQELNIGWIINKVDWNSDSFSRLLSSCQRLEKINLEYCIAFTERDLRALMLCKNLKYLNLSGIDSVTPDLCCEILLKCAKLEKIVFDRSCRLISKSLVDQWNEEYQHVLFIYL
ncbi:F-box/LRR-repeat protein 2 [Solenopsis invicta]|uniref:F-box/LRR-repeat protein 2 n=1 Tax=Solenopsis invicta TaxID=13686 RepID=UPI00193D1392|nr:F-box/LRR-repeat protein 2 [Solenopsis invicta]